jgi:hypothetical protein
MYKKFCNKDQTNLVKANWEKKTNSIIESRNIEIKQKNFIETKEKFLQLRRKKISQLLISEEISYREELNRIQETPDEVRKRMEKKLIELKKEKEEERLEFVKTNIKRRFLQSADELRKNERDAIALSCYLTQENQMLDKINIRIKAKKEEEIFDKLRSYDIQRQCK